MAPFTDDEMAFLGNQIRIGFLQQAGEPDIHHDKYLEYRMDGGTRYLLLGEAGEVVVVRAEGQEPISIDREAWDKLPKLAPDADKIAQLSEIEGKALSSDQNSRFKTGYQPTPLPGATIAEDEESDPQALREMRMNQLQHMMPEQRERWLRHILELQERENQEHDK